MYYVQDIFCNSDIRFMKESLNYFVFKILGRVLSKVTFLKLNGNRVLIFSCAQHFAVT